MSAIVDPPTVPPVVHPILGNLNNIQGDLWSKGFPKYNETYYLFTIKQERAADFARALRNMLTLQPHLISNLPMVKNNWAEIINHKQAAGSTGSAKLPMPNALIAFTYKGLETIQSGLSQPKSLKLTLIRERTDPSFAGGMRSDVRLNDPTTDLDSLFADTQVIHGMLKVAGSCIQDVNQRLQDIKISLGRETGVISDVPGGNEGRLDGATREKPHRGKEHFGFEDGISQPLIEGVDDDKVVSATPIMVTNPQILLVTKDTRTFEGGIQRPSWMNQGSFLVFRKLEQNVKAFNTLKQDYAKYGCESAEHMGAKLMGRWPSGAPITVPDYHTSDAPDVDHEKVKKMNNFSYEKLDAPPHMCPLAAHIRKTNPRISDSNSSDQGLKFSKMIRSGIPYGPDYVSGEVEGPESKRGLLFACYQAYIEDGFQHMQSFWCNNKDFPPGKGSGIDPIVGQALSAEDMKTKITEGKEAMTLPTGNSQLVTFRGGEYFFVPSIAALRVALSDAKA